MRNGFTAGGVLGGKRRSAAVPGRGPSPARSANGLNLRAVVLTTYVQLDGPAAFDEQQAGAQAFPSGISAVYCDVVCISSMSGFKGAPLKRVLVAQDAGMHEGHVWLPRAATLDVNGDAIGAADLDPMQLDGDHVLVQFLDDDLSKPFVAKRFQHPHMGRGNESLAQAGHRQKLKEADGSPWLIKHKGSFFGVDKDGNLLFEGTRAHSGAYDVSGKEVPSSDASHGGVLLKLASGTTFRVQGLDAAGTTDTFDLRVFTDEFVLKQAGDNALRVIGKAANTTMQVGDGAKHVAIVEALQALYTALKAKLDAFDAHVHPTGMGPSGPPAPLIVAPAWDAAINSSKISIPNG
jgi:hypothetical protein